MTFTSFLVIPSFSKEAVRSNSRDLPQPATKNTISRNSKFHFIVQLSLGLLTTIPSSALFLAIMCAGKMPRQKTFG